MLAVVAKGKTPIAVVQRSMLKSAIRGVVPVCAVFACSGGKGGDAGPAIFVQDSSGVAVIETYRATWVAEPPMRWALTREALLVFGGADEEVSALLHPLLSVVRLDTGRFVAAGENSVIAWFSSDGVFEFKRGGRGRGPGEFQYIGALIHLGADSIAVVDQGVRLTRFDGAGRHHQALQITGTRIFKVSRLDREWMGWSSAVVSASRFDDDTTVPGFYRPGRALLLHDESGGLSDTFGVYPAEYRRAHSANPTAPAGNRLETRSAPVLLLSVPSSYAVWNGSVVIGTGEDHHLVVVDRSGAVQRIIRWRGEDLNVTSRDHDRWRSGMVAMTRFSGEMPVAEQKREMMERLTSYSVASRKGAYTDLVPDGAGNLWVRRNVPPDEPEAYSVLSADGAWLGDIEMPAGFRVTQIGRDFVLGIRVDSLDVAHVVMYGLIKPEAPYGHVR